MNYLVISPYYPQNFQQFTIELANKGINVLGMAKNLTSNWMNLYAIA